MAGNLRALESRIDNIRSQLDVRATSGGKGDFEDGYVRGFRDSQKVGSASAARRRMDEDYGARDDRFHVGYVQGLRDAGMTGMTTSMHNLAVRGQPSTGGYSTGYMQGFRDGNSGIFGDRITTTLLRRLEEQYPSQDEFRQGYVDGFKEGAGSRDKKEDNGDARLLQKSLSELTERLSSLEKHKGGDETHSTKIYHVYNQQPEVVGFSSSGQQLAHELEEMSSSRRSTLRRHYTPGDYLKYASDIDGYGSLRQNRRSLSASALGRGAAAVDSSSSEQPTHNWPDDLMDIVQEPMGQTLDRMKKFSNSMNQVSQADASGRNIEHEPLLSGDGAVKESVQESYQKSYKEEYSVGR